MAAKIWIPKMNGEGAVGGAGQLVRLPTRSSVNSYLINSSFIFRWSTRTLCLWSTRTF